MNTVSARGDVIAASIKGVINTLLQRGVRFLLLHYTKLTCYLHRETKASMMLKKSQNIQNRKKLTIEIQPVRPTEVCGKVYSEKNRLSLLKYHCYCPMLSMQTITTAVGLETRPFFITFIGFNCCPGKIS